MTLNDQAQNKIYLKKLPNIVLIPNHGRNGFLPDYPFCGKREIFCGPNFQNEESKERKYIRTNGRFFDIEDVLSKLDERDQRIDLVFAPLEVNTTCFPKNLHKINCPKIALVFDTHHKMYPISTLINYVKREKFTHLFIYAQPAHLHFFYEAGLTNLALYPRIAQDFGVMNYKKSGVTYIGLKWSSSHPRRSRMVQFLEKKLPKNNIPFHIYNQLPRTEWLKVLMKSKIIVVSSLNGQFTPQIYSCLFAGILCFIDELSEQTFLYRFFEPGKHLVTWRNFNDLLEKLIYFYNHPDEAEEIAKAGKIQAEKKFTTSENYATSISEFVFENKIDPRLLATNDKRCQQIRSESSEYFNARVRLYENMQELHRIHESLTLISITQNNLKPSADLADLPRLRITHAFVTDNPKYEADLFFQNVGVNHQIQTIKLDKIQKTRSYDVGILETSVKENEWKLLVKSISTLLKKNSLLWVLGELNPFQKDILKKEGFNQYVLKKDLITVNLKKFSRNICFLFWKLGKYPFPYLTLKPAMEKVPNLNIFLRGWQAHFPFLY